MLRPLKTQKTLRPRTRPHLSALIALAVAACGEDPRPAMVPQYPSPMAEDVRAHDRLTPTAPDGDTLSLPGRLPGRVEVLDRGGDHWLIHFHGASFVPHQAQSGLVIAVNLGSGSSAYERPFADAGSFGQLVDEVSGRVGRSPETITLSAWSAGYGSLRAILRQSTEYEIDAVVLLDGLHTDYVPDRLTLHEGGQLNEEKLTPFEEFARLAAAGERTMLITHSEIFPGTYASTTETAVWIAEAMDIPREAVLEWGPLGMQLLSRAQSGRLTILGFAGNTAPDHVDHLHALPELIARYRPPG